MNGPSAGMLADLSLKEPASSGYSREDDRTWRKLQDRLFPIQDRLAFDAYLDCRAAMLGGVPGVPDPAEVSRRIEARSGFSIVPVGGLVRAAEFFDSLRQGSFTANTSARKPDQWRFCPSPDWFHESLGHAASLGDPRIAALYRRFGEAAAQAPDKDGLRRLGRLFWFAFEVGLVRERGTVKAFGAAILSSLSELENVGRGELRAFDPAEIERTAYDYRGTQPLYFVADGVDHLLDSLAVHLECQT
ncbi:MAG: hypothetical protein HYZ75_00160 [Elusimicrobia bacterium]|nr:hypothetical protein [Elusimicrobiota bacterium]